MRKLALFLRAVNVGGRKLSMAEFRAALSDAGFEAVETLLASGNAVVATKAEASVVEAEVEALLAETHGLPTPVLARDAAGLAAILASNPYRDMARDDPSHLIVVLLRGAPKAEVAELARYCTQGETVAAGPGCLYIAYPAGVGVSKLGMKEIERRLGVVGTGRNWNTIGKMLERLAA
jgi:uncharacterized protein (DUF1697 family)